MKHFLKLSIVAALLCGTFSFVSAQESAQVTRSRTTLCNAGLALSDEQALDFITSRCGASAAEEWSGGVRLYKTGRGLLISSAVIIPVGSLAAGLGVPLMLGGAIAATPEAAAGQSGDNELLHIGSGMFYGGLAVAAVGIGLLIPGAICLPMGKNRMNDVVDRCNGTASQALSLNFGAAEHGIGLTLRF